MDTANDRTNYDSEYPPPSFPPDVRRNIVRVGKGTRFPGRNIVFLCIEELTEKNVYFIRSIYTTTRRTRREKDLKLLDARASVMSRDTERSHLVIKPLFSYSKLLLWQ